MKIRFWRLSEDSILRACLKILSPADRKKLILVSIVQIALSLLDLIAIALVGILGAITIRGVSLQEPGNRASAVLDFLHLSQFSFQSTVAIIAIFVGLLFIIRTFATIYLTRRTFFFLAIRGAIISANLVAKLFSQPILNIQRRTTQATIFSLTTGVEAIVLRIIGPSIAMVADLSILLVLTIGLFVLDPLTAISAIVLFGFIGLIIYLLMHKRARAIGESNSLLEIESREKMLEALTSYRELTVGNRKGHYSELIGKLRQDVSQTSAEMAFLPNISKYIIESSVVVGAILVSGIQFLLNDASRAIGTLSIFLVAGMRIAPAALRLQQSAILIRTSAGAAQPTLDLVESLNKIPEIQPSNNGLDLSHDGFLPKIEIRNTSLIYPDSNIPAVSEISLIVEPGTTVAFVGSSGAGKTTIIDILLGVLQPQEGEVLISGQSPSDASKSWPGAIAYVPQDVAIASGTIRKNVALGFPIELATDELVKAALKTAGLDLFIDSLANGVDTTVGENGTKLSGGQRQRLGIARAMFTKPALLVLDEATSALDGETELKVSDAIRNLHGSATVVLIAHRLSTVREADKVIYMAEGKIVASGTFDEVRSQVPDFDRQAVLMGL